MSEKPVQIRYALGASEESALHGVRPPVPVHAALVEQAALVVEAVSKLVPDDGAKSTEIARHGSETAANVLGTGTFGCAASWSEPVDAEEGRLQDGAGNENGVGVAFVERVDIRAAEAAGCMS